VDVSRAPNRGRRGSGGIDVEGVPAFPRHLRAHPHLAHTAPEAAMAYIVALPETSRIMLMTCEPLEQWVHSQDIPHS
jgi:hypothetical protein